MSEAGQPREVTAAAVAATDATLDPGRLAGVTAIWIRELRGRMRGKRAFIFITFYLSPPGRDLLGSAPADRGRSVRSARGAGLRAGRLQRRPYIETLVVVALAPSYTAGAISQEREKQTYDLLAVTPISSLAIVLGKLLSGLSYLGLVVVASIPIASIAFLFGGIDVIDSFAATRPRGDRDRRRLDRGLVLRGDEANPTGDRIGLRRHRALVLGATGTWLGLDSRAQSEGGSRPPEALLYLDPFSAVSDVVCQATGSGCFRRPEPGPDNRSCEEQPVPAAPVQFGPNGVPVGGQFIQPPQPVFAGGDFWPKTVLAYMLLTPIAIIGAAQSISPTRRWHWNWPGRTRRQSLSGEAIDD